MSKLYFKYGVMGSSKTANLLMTKYNYEQQGFKVLLLKTNLDNRDVVNGEKIVRTRIGLSSQCITFSPQDNLIELFNNLNECEKYDLIVVDECQFLTEKQVDQLKQLSFMYNVFCYGLLTNFRTKLFDGSKRLVEIADKLEEIKFVCHCGKKAMVNVRKINGEIVTEGDVVAIEKNNNVEYEPMCYECYLEALKNQEKK